MEDKILRIKNIIDNQCSKWCRWFSEREGEKKNIIIQRHCKTCIYEKIRNIIEE